MSEIEHKTKEIERYLISKKNLLIGAKISFILLLLTGFGQEYLQTLGYKEKYKYSWAEWNTIQFLLLLALCIPFVIMPLHKFVKDRIINRYIWDIKHAIFTKSLDQFNSEYQISFNSCLPQKDIDHLKLEKGWVTFVYGDDLIFGTINNVRFRIGEVHSNGFIKRYFNGIIAVLIFDEMIESTQFTVATSHLPKHFQVHYSDNKIYLLSESNSKHFELVIKRNKTNREKLINDQSYFNEIIITLDHLTRSIDH